MLDCFDQIFEFSVGYELSRWFPCRLLLQHSKNKIFDKVLLKFYCQNGQFYSKMASFESKRLISGQNGLFLIVMGNFPSKVGAFLRKKWIFLIRKWEKYGQNQLFCVENGKSMVKIGDSFDKMAILTQKWGSKWVVLGQKCPISVKNG